MVGILNELINKHSELKTDEIGKVVCYQIIACPLCKGSGRGRKIVGGYVLCPRCNGSGTAERQIDAKTALELMESESYE